MADEGLQSQVHAKADVKRRKPSKDTVFCDRTLNPPRTPQHPSEFSLLLGRVMAQYPGAAWYKLIVNSPVQAKYAKSDEGRASKVSDPEPPAHLSDRLGPFSFLAA